MSSQTEACRPSQGGTSPHEARSSTFMRTSHSYRSHLRTDGFPFAKDELDNPSLGSAGFDSHAFLARPLVEGGLEVMRITREVLTVNGPPDRSVHPLLPRVKSTPTRSVGVYALGHM